MIRVAADNWSFEDSETGERFVPFGVNYFDPHTGFAPKLWQKFDAAKVKEHFRLLEGIGANVVRVFVTSASFFPEGKEIPGEALAKFDQMLEMGERHGIKIHPTGPEAWEGRPAWTEGDLFADPEKLEIQERFWHLFAGRYADHPGIFAYDLRNEPHPPWESPHLAQVWQSWAKEHMPAMRPVWEELEKLGGRVPPEDHSAGREITFAYCLVRNSICAEWVRRQAAAIRSVDSNHMVTLGIHKPPFTLGGFECPDYAEYLDFTCQHAYPDADPYASPQAFEHELLTHVIRVLYAYTGKPVVLQEHSWYGGNQEPFTTYHGKITGSVTRPPATEEDQARFNEAVVRRTMGMASGWLCWAFADTPSATDCTRYSGLFTEDFRLKRWGERFRALKEELRANPPKPAQPEKVIGLDLREFYRFWHNPEYPKPMLEIYRRLAEVLPETGRAIFQIAPTARDLFAQAR